VERTIDGLRFNVAVDTTTVAALLALAAAYIAISMIMQMRPTARQGVAFIAALVAILVAITGPLDELTQERSFAVYIFQQMLLVFVVPPLLLFGLPGWMLRPVMTNKYVEPIARVLTRPLFAFLLFAAVFTLVHYPAVCDIASAISIHSTAVCTCCCSLQVPCCGGPC